MEVIDVDSLGQCRTCFVRQAVMIALQVVFGNLHQLLLGVVVKYINVGVGDS